MLLDKQENVLQVIWLATLSEEAVGEPGTACSSRRPGRGGRE